MKRLLKGAEGPKFRIGRPRSEQRDHYESMLFGKKWKRSLMNPKFLAQLDRCADDNARRVLLGIKG